MARFGFADGATHKLHTQVEFGTELVVPVDYFSPHAAPSSAPRYRLRGIVRHHGGTATSGHYTACVMLSTPALKNKPPADEWFLCNDAIVEPMSEADVLASRSSVYLLMYERVQADHDGEQ